MGLATYTLRMAAVAAPAAALLAFGGKPMPTGWLDGIVMPGATLGHAAAVVGFWAIGSAATAGGIVGLLWLARAYWREWRHREKAGATG